MSGAYVARPADGVGSGLGVVVGMEMFGVTDHVRDVCDRLAALGHTALAPDFYHRIEDGIELPPDEAGRARGLELAGILTRDDALADVRAAIDELRDGGADHLAMVGMSYGGHIAYLAACELPLEVTAVLYGGWIPTTDIALSRPEPTLTLTPGITGRRVAADRRTALVSLTM